MRTYLMLFLFMGLAVTSQAEPTDVFEEKRFSRGNHVIQYRIMYPKNFDEHVQYPLVLFLHGAGERGDDNLSQLRHGAELFIRDRGRAGFNPIVVFPQASVTDYWASVEVDRTKKPFLFTYQHQSPPTEAMAAVLALLDNIISQPYVDSSRIYTGGLSMGGMGVFELLARRPNIFAAAFVICGGADSEVVESYRRDMALWIFHGAKDDVVAPHYAQRVVEALRDRGNPVKWTLYPEANHNSWDNAFAEPELLPWLFSHRLSGEMATTEGEL